VLQSVLGVTAVELNDLSKGVYRNLWRQSPKIGINTGFKLIHQAPGLQVWGLPLNVDEGSPFCLQGLHCPGEDLLDPIWRPFHNETGYTQPCPLQSCRIKESSVVMVVALAAAEGRWIPGVYPRQSAQEDGGISDGAGHGPRCILILRNRYYSPPADQPHRRLDTNDGIGACRTQDRPRSLGSNGHHHQVGGNGGPRARA